MAVLEQTPRQLEQATLQMELGDHLIMQMDLEEAEAVEGQLVLLLELQVTVQGTRSTAVVVVAGK
jgi:hypothetical protein